MDRHGTGATSMGRAGCDDSSIHPHLHPVVPAVSGVDLSIPVGFSSGGNGVDGGTHPRREM